MSLRNMAEVAALILLICINPGDLFPQAPVRLTLREAKTMALNNHPQILAAQNEAAYTNEQITVLRAPYFPTPGLLLRRRSRTPTSYPSGEYQCVVR